MIAKIAVAAANFAIDKPYSYRIPHAMILQSGMRVTVPFGRGNRFTEGIVLGVEDGYGENLKVVAACLDEQPLLDEGMLRLAAFLRERYFCTFYSAIRTMLPAGLWFQTKDRYSLTEDTSWKDAAIKQPDARAVLEIIHALGGEAEATQLREAVPEEDAFRKAVNYLIRKKWLLAKTDYHRRANDKTEKIATLAVSAEEAMAYADSRPKSAAMQRSVLQTLCAVGSVSVKELCYFTGAGVATVNRLEKLGFLELSVRDVLRCREINRSNWMARWC